MHHHSAHAKKLRLTNILLDALVATGDAQQQADVDQATRHLVLERLTVQELTEPGPDGTVRLDLTPLVFGALDLMLWLTRALADHAKVDALDVLAELRDVVSVWQQDAGLSEGGLKSN